MSTPRTGAAWAVLDGRLYVIGGRSSGGVLLQSAEVFDPATGWSAIAPLEDPLAEARAVVLDEAIYLLGGRDAEGASDGVEVYRPDEDQWDSADNLGERRIGLAAGAVDDQLFVLGGAGRDGVLLTSAEQFQGGQWEPYPTWSLSPPRALAGSASLDGAIVVAGGFSGAGPLASVERFVPGEARESLPPLLQARGGLALATDGAALFAVGGRDAANGRTVRVERLEAEDDAWTALTPLPAAREGAAAAVLGADLYVVGGTGEFGTVFASMVRLANVTVGAEDGPEPAAPALALAGPNPTRGPVRLRYTLLTPTEARLTVVDVRGREVAVLVQGSAAAGPHAATWDASGLPAGVYAARLTTPAGAAVVRFVVVR